MTIIERLQDLVRIPSYSGEEAEVQKYIAETLQSSGVESFYQGENLVVHLKGKDPKRAFIFNGHVDVVDVGNLKNWNSSPFEPVVDDDKLFGRGSSDMKSGVAGMIETAISLAANHSLPTDVWFTFVVREETDGSGTQDFVQWFRGEGHLDSYEDIAAVFTEPTCLRTVEYGHRGNYFLKAKVKGEAGHSSRPESIQPHAIVVMNGFITDLAAASEEWQKQFERSDFGPPTITPTSIEAKSISPNRTAEYCQAVFDLRTIPGFHEEAFGAVSKIAKAHGIEVSFLFPPAPYGYTKPDAKIVKAVQTVTPKVRLKVNEASNDLGFVTVVGIDGIIFGPGDMGFAHRTNEFVELSQVKAAPELFEKIYFEWAKQ